MSALLRSPVSTAICVTTTEMHTGGEAVRIIEAGYPTPQGDTILEKIEDLKNNYDEYRKFVILEPHGHFDMYGVLLVMPDNPEADVAAIFLQNEGYSTMCGHACIALTRYAIDRRLIRRPVSFPETQVNIQTPCGLINAYASVQLTEGNIIETGRCRFDSVPSFVVATDVEINADDYGPVKVDVIYGGAFYAAVAAADLGLDFKVSSLNDIKIAATTVKAVTKSAVALSHPETPAFLYGVLVVDSRDTKTSDVTTNICIFADSETDRSPCGSGSSALTALMHHRGLLATGQAQIFRNGITGSEFVAKPIRETEVGGRKAVIVNIEGQGYYTGNSTFILEKGDVLGRGFLVK